MASATTPWRVDVHAGNLQEVAEWTGMARSATHAEAIAVALASTAYKVRTGAPCGRRLWAEARAEPEGSAPNPILTLWEDALIAGPPEGRRFHEEAVKRAAQALLRLIAQDHGNGLRGLLSTQVGTASTSQAPSGGLMLTRYRTSAMLEGRSGWWTPLDVSDPHKVAIAALALSNPDTDRNGDYVTIGLQESATLRAAQCLELRAKRHDDVMTVARFMQRLGLSGEARLVSAPTDHADAGDDAA